MVSNKVKFVWDDTCQKAFNKIKEVISRETLLAFPDFEKEFHIYTDASNYQLGAVIMQDDKPLAFYSRKLKDAQKKYTTGKKELLSIVETLKEFKNILWGQKLIVHTDHKNILYDKMASERVCRWRTMLEEYGAEFVHIAGEHNVIADALSRLDARWADDAYDEFNEVPELINVMEAYPITAQEVEETAFLIFPP